MSEVLLFGSDGAVVSRIARGVFVHGNRVEVRAEGQPDEAGKRLDDGGLLLEGEADRRAIADAIEDVAAHLAQVCRAVRACDLHIGFDHVDEDVREFADDASGLARRELLKAEALRLSVVVRHLVSLLDFPGSPTPSEDAA